MVRELHYWTLMAVSKEMMQRGLVSQGTVDTIEKMLSELYTSMIARLIS